MALFSRLPVLPVVPLPYEGESLLSWLYAIAHRYSIGIDLFLRQIGHPGPDFIPLFVRPPRRLIEKLHYYTGVNVSRLHAMALRLNDVGLEVDCCHSWHPCAECHAEAYSAVGRPVVLLASHVPWHIACPRHVHWRDLPDVHGGAQLSMLQRSSSSLLEALDAGAQSIVRTLPQPLVRIGVAKFVRLALLVHTHLQVSITAVRSRRDQIAFAIRQIHIADERSTPHRQRGDTNSLLISMLFVRHLAHGLAWNIEASTLDVVGRAFLSLIEREVDHPALFLEKRGRFLWLAEQMATAFVGPPSLDRTSFPVDPLAIHVLYGHEAAQRKSRIEWLRKHRRRFSGEAPHSGKEIEALLRARRQEPAAQLS